MDRNLAVTIIMLLIMVITFFSSCANAQQKHYNNHANYKLWNSYKSCSAYGNP